MCESSLTQLKKEKDVNFIRIQTTLRAAILLCVH